MGAWWIWTIAGVLAAVLLLGLVGWLAVRRWDGETRALVGRIGRLPWRGKARLAWRLFRDGRVPLWVRAIIPALILYLALPIDIIPDFIPVLGHLDDVLVVLLAGGVLLRFTPRQVIDEHLGALENVGA